MTRAQRIAKRAHLLAAPRSAALAQRSILFLAARAAISLLRGEPCIAFNMVGRRLLS
jgi:hypothetical protein